MRSIVLCALLACAGCLDYEIRVSTVVAPDGSMQRVVKIREADESKTWRRLQPPGKPYALAGSDEEGFTANAKLPAGRHANGIRAILANVEGDYSGADDVAGMPAAEGAVSVEVYDLGIGTLYWYHETIALGADPVKFRKEFTRWIDVGFEVFMEALATRFPDVDFEPVERNARRTLLPRIVSAIRTAHLALGGLLEDYREHNYSRSAAHWLDHPHMKVLLFELAQLGIERRADAGPVETMDQYFSEAAWNIGPELKLLGEFLKPLERLPAQKREEIKKYLIEIDEQVEDDVGAAMERLYPIEEEREKIERAALETAVAGLGAYVTYGLFDKFDFRHEVKLPGILVRTNGDLATGGSVRWEVDKEFLLLVSPKLTAYSFVPAPWLKEREFHATRLIEAREALWGLDAEARAKVAALARKAAADDWNIGKLVSDDPENESYADALEHLKRAVGK